MSPACAGADSATEVPAVDVEDQAVELFIQALNLRHGYDFSGYARASLKRRVAQLVRDLALPNIGALLPHVLYEPELIDTIITRLSVPASELFRDPHMFATLKRDVLPVLATYPRINIWQAGCANGEEVYSLAILLAEADLGVRSRIYATDFNDSALERAAAGIFNGQQISQAAVNYAAAGGMRRFHDYYDARYGLVRMRKALLDRVVFAYHNLVTDGVFAEAQLIMCRNVLIYFTQPLKDRVLQLFADSLVQGGYLVLGSKETLQFSALADRFEPVCAANRIYRLKKDRA